MTQFGFSINTENCVGCKACEIACKNRNELESPGPRLRHVVAVQSGVFPTTKTVYASMGCMHCGNPACVEVCPAGAIEKRAEDGVVIANRSKCIGCHYCYFACPFGVPQYREDDGTMIKCDACTDRRAMGLEPACAHTCFYGGIKAGDLAELSAEDKQDRAATLGHDTNPSILIDERGAKFL